MKLIIKYSMVIFFFTILKTPIYASNCTSHAHEKENKNILNSNVTYDVPCEISGTTLMAVSIESCKKLREKISNHDHD